MFKSLFTLVLTREHKTEFFYCNKYFSQKKLIPSGGAIGLTRGQMWRINGFPNNFLGWGGEDDVIHLRIKQVGMTFHRLPFHIAKFKKS